MNNSDVMAVSRLAGPVPPEKPLSVFGFVRAARDNILNAIPKAAYEQPIYTMKIGTRQVTLVSDPEGVKHVLLDNVANYPKAPEEIDVLGAAFGEGLLTSEGEKWRRHRRIMAPSFDHKSILSYAPRMAETADAYLAGWDALGKGATVDIAQEMTRLTLQIISRTMFSTADSGIGQLMSDTLARGTAEFGFSLIDMLPLVGPWRMRRRIASIHRIFGQLDKSMYALIEAREGRPAPSQMDLLDRLIAARDSETGAKMTNKEIRDEVVIIFIAGHETTAVAMTFVWYLLSQHPEIEAKLHRELDEVLAGRMPVHEDLARLAYTRMVIEEAMRLYPPAPGLSNRAPQADDTICGTPVKKRSAVIVLPWVVHRHRAFWNDPDRFDPERFSAERARDRSRFAYLPFGGGPRICIGASLALTEASLILATMAQRYRLRLAPGENVELLHRITLRPRNGIRMMLEPRALPATHAA